MSKTKGFLMAAGIVLAMAFTFSCSSDDGGGGEQSSPSGGDGSSSSVGGGGNSSSSGGSGGNGDRDSRLVTGSGEAWIRNGSNEGWILNSKGEYFFIEMSNGTWYYEDDLEGVAWSASGGTLTLSDGKNAETYTYSVSGNQLTTHRNDRTIVYVKTSGINPVHEQGGGSH